MNGTRLRYGGGAGYAKDPACGMQVEKSNAPATTTHGGQRYYFCSDRCHDAFTTATTPPRDEHPANPPANC